MRTNDPDSAPISRRVAGSKRADFVASLAAGLRVLAAFSPDRPDCGVGELARVLDMDKRRTQRLVSTLFELGFLEQDQTTRKYRPGISVLDLGYAALGSLDVRQVALPFMRQLLEQFGQSVNLAVRSNLDVIMVECLRGERYRIGVQVHVGDRLPVHVSSLGRAILSRLSAPELDQVVERLSAEYGNRHTVDVRGELEQQLQKARQRGYAVMDQETSRGVRSVAAPVVSRDGGVVAAINVAMPTPLMSMEQMVTEVAPAVVRTAELVSERLGPQVHGPNEGQVAHM